MEIFYQQEFVPQHKIKQKNSPANMQHSETAETVLLRSTALAQRSSNVAFVTRCLRTFTSLEFYWQLGQGKGNKPVCCETRGSQDAFRFAPRKYFLSKQML